ncbi:unnamed protein product [Zymoseptoria tritici ST99CH_1E4]|uniref:RNA helicase n=1 Tax=Zymoseptoria tritici ST99CH_1E4 TaxID=1276532 RepID=A0A2H1FJP9_ZYMTR|nr:unnamed protein product [Zymoseptoria tritici ST99CH_1E4]
MQPTEAAKNNPITTTIINITMSSKPCGHTGISRAGCPACDLAEIWAEYSATERRCKQAGEDAVRLHELSRHATGSDAKAVEKQQQDAERLQNELAARLSLYAEKSKPVNARIQDLQKSNDPTVFDKLAQEYQDDAMVTARANNPQINEEKRLVFHPANPEATETEGGGLERSAFPATMDHLLDNPVGFHIGLALGRDTEWNPSKAVGLSGAPAPMSIGATWGLFGVPTSENEFTTQTTPSILLKNVTDQVLNIFQLGMNPLSFDFIEPPAPETMMRSLEELHEFDLFNITEQVLTPLGKKVSKLGMAPHLAIALLESPRYGCSSQVLSIISMLDATDSADLWRQGFSPTEKAQRKEAKQYFQHPRGDHPTLLDIYQAWRMTHDDDKFVFCTKYYLNMDVLERADQVRKKLRQEMKSSALEIPLVALDVQDPDYYPKVLRALCAGYFMRSAKRATTTTSNNRRIPDEYDTVKRLVRAEKPDWVRFGAQVSPHWVIYEKCQNVKGTPTLSTMSAVEPEWLVEGKDLYWDLEAFPPSHIKDALLETMKNMTGMSQADLGMPEDLGVPEP